MLPLRAFEAFLMLPAQEQHIGSIRFALLRALPEWHADINRRTDENGSEAYTVTLTQGDKVLQGYHEADEQPEQIAQMYAWRVQLMKTTA